MAVMVPSLPALQVSRLMGMGPEENVADQIAGKLEDMLDVVRKVGACTSLRLCVTTLKSVTITFRPTPAIDAICRVGGVFGVSCSHCESAV